MLIILDSYLVNNNLLLFWHATCFKNTQIALGQCQKARIKNQIHWKLEEGYNYERFKMSKMRSKI